MMPFVLTMTHCHNVLLFSLPFVPCQKSEHVYVEGDMTNNETLNAFADCEKLPNGRNVSEVV